MTCYWVMPFQKIRSRDDCRTWETQTVQVEQFAAQLTHLELG